MNYPDPQNSWNPWNPCTSEIILRGLCNPRGLRLKDDGTLLLVEAGTGEVHQPFSGRLLQFRPDGAGGYLAPETLASGFRSMNMQSRMCRDEIFGLADVAFGGGRWLLSQTDYVDGSRILDLSTSPPTVLFHSRGNLNALCYHPQRNSWLSVKPDTNQVIEFVENRPESVRAIFLPLTGGQESVPVSLLCEPERETVLVSLFSGELRHDPAKTGIEFQKQVGQVVRVDLESGTVTPVIEGLTLPTGLALSARGQLLVLELCDDFLQAMPPIAVPQQAWHGGFKRFSGRLQCFDLHTGKVATLAEQLDTPSNLCVFNNTVLISEGMGLPGRPIANAEGNTTPLDGYVRKLTLPLVI